MQEITDVSALIARVRDRDSQAAEELVRRYEHELQAEIRQYLRRGKLRRVVDSQDISQSVFASFFIRLSLGEYNLDNSGDLVKLLMRMARNKTYAQMRLQYADRRDIRRTTVLNETHQEKAIAVQDKTPSQKIELTELLNSVWDRLSESERTIAEQRTSGQTWEQIADTFDEKTDTIRKRFQRAVDRVGRELEEDA